MFCLQNVYYHTHRNPNLIAIVPVEEPASFQQAQVTRHVEKTEESRTEEVELHPQGRFILLRTSYVTRIIFSKTETLLFQKYQNSIVLKTMAVRQKKRTQKNTKASLLLTKRKLL